MFIFNFVDKRRICLPAQLKMYTCNSNHFCAIVELSLFHSHSASKFIIFKDDDSFFAKGLPLFWLN